MDDKVRLVGISNFVRFSDGASENRLVLELPNGVQVSAFVNDDELAIIVNAFAPQQKTASNVTPPAPVYPAPVIATKEDNPFVQEELPNGEQALVFSGPPDVAPVRPKSKLVGVDNMGNPIVRFDGAEDPNEVTGTTGERDEDGVAQL